MVTGGLLMKHDFQNLTMKELKKYVLENRNDEDAFRVLVDRIEQQPTKQIHNEASLEKFSELLQKHQQLRNN